MSLVIAGKGVPSSVEYLSATRVCPIQAIYQHSREGIKLPHIDAQDGRAGVCAGEEMMVPSRRW